MTCLGLGSRWPSNGRQFSLLLYLPQGGIYRCQRSQAIRAAKPPQRLCQWKQGRSLIDGIDCLDGLGFPISLYSSHFHCLLLVIISTYLFGFGKLALPISSKQPHSKMRCIGQYIRSFHSVIQEISYVSIGNATLNLVS